MKQVRIHTSVALAIVLASNECFSTAFLHSPPSKQLLQQSSGGLRSNTPPQTCLLRHQSSPHYVAVDRLLSHDTEDKHEKSPPSSSSSSSRNKNNNQLQSLWVFVHNLQRERRENNGSSNNKYNKNRGGATQPPRSSQSRPPKPATARTTESEPEKRHNPAKSLVLFLRKNKFSLDPAEGKIASTTTPSSPAGNQKQPPPEVEPFSRAVVQAIRLASEQGDYKLILSLVEASIDFANEYPIIMPRVFGEAIDGLSKTSANMAKINQLWNLGTSEQSKTFLTEPLGTFELNVMIKTIASRGKIRATLNFYNEHTQQLLSSSSTSHHQNNETILADAILSIAPDPYTLSSIFSALQESITDDEPSKMQNYSQPTTTANSSTPETITSVGPPSQCWQWNEAMNLLESYKMQESALPPLNNHVFASLLKLNDRITQIFLPPAHHGPRMALHLLNAMHSIGISPDVVTCTLIISNLGYQWKTAVNLLYAMKTMPRSSSTAGTGEHHQISSSWTLPRPNVYTYSAVITICAHCHQYQTAMELLQEMKNDDTLDSPNTWVYNAALLATTRSDSLTILTGESSAALQQEHATSPKPKRNRDRLLMALNLLREMQEDGDRSCRPDTVTYNTVLATLDGIAGPSEPDAVAVDRLENQFASLLDLTTERETEHAFEERAAHSLMDEMEQNGILRDSITYRNALLAVRFSHNIRTSVWRILDRALRDQGALAANARQLAGKAADGVSFVFDTAMAVLASHGDADGVLLTFAKMMEHSTAKSHVITESIFGAQINFIQSLGHAKGSSSSAFIPLFLEATKGDRLVKLAVTKEYPSMDSRLFVYNTKNEMLFSTAISSCMEANDIDSARKVLAMMKEEGLQPSELSLQEIARTYARLAITASGDEASSSTRQLSKNQKRMQQEETSLERTDVADVQLPGEEELVTGNEDIMGLSKKRARNAYNIATKTLKDAPASLLSTVARSCASVGLWKEASSILKRLHSRIPLHIHDLQSIGSIGATQAVLPGLHRALLRAASIQGNVTAALWFVEDIQNLSRRMEKSSRRQREEEDELFASSTGNQVIQRQDHAAVIPSDHLAETLAMSAEDWKLLMIAAAKCGHWRVCLSTLQFLRPFVEATHPSSLGITVEERSRRYDHLAPGLAVAVKCLEVRSQYGWAMRVIDDWIEWSGRRPPKAAVLSAIRILSHRHRGTEVNNLLVRCTLGDGAALLSYGNDDTNKYEMALYVGAIIALHNEGLYNDADDAFVAAVNAKFLPFDLKSEDIDGKQHIVLDLHGMNLPVAHSAVRVALRQELASASWTNDDSGESSLIIVTGMGRGSALRMRPVLRPEVQRMLIEEFYPPLSTTSIPGNMGALRVPATSISAWLAHQRRQKGSRMMAVASVLRGLSSGDRIRQSLARKMQAQTEASRDQDEEESNAAPQ